MPRVDYKGAIHIHTDYSDGGGDMEEVVSSAGCAGLDFLVVSDHNTLAPKKDGWEGWKEGVLVVVAAEITTNLRGHILALEVNDVDGLGFLSAEEYLPKVKGQGGWAFVVHPLGRGDYNPKKKREAWNDWTRPEIDGIEIWDYMHDWIEGLNYRRFLDYFLHPESKITGPRQEVLAIWDELGKRRKVVGIGGLDAHSRRAFFAKIQVFPYEELFKTIRTHILSEPFTGVDEEDIKRVTSALVEGRSFVAYDFLADATGFAFTASDSLGTYEMGQEITSSPPGLHMSLAKAEGEAPGRFDRGPVEFSVTSPFEAEIALLKDGLVVSRVNGTSLKFVSDKSGVYRAEVKLDTKPWVFSNPIYLR